MTGISNLVHGCCLGVTEVLNSQRKLVIVFSAACFYLGFKVEFLSMDICITSLIITWAWLVLYYLLPLSVSICICIYLGIPDNFQDLESTAHIL